MSGTSKSVLAWHWLRDDRKLGYSDGRLVETGKTYEVDGPVHLCNHGLHASIDAMDALSYAPGPIVCRVRLSGSVVLGEDKAVATKRTVLWMADATRTLHEFAIQRAREALMRERKAGREPDPRSWAAIEAKIAWLDGKCSDVDLAAAWAAARAAAWDAARAAAWDAARAAAWAAAWDAARAAAWAAARAAAWDAASQRQSKTLHRMLMELKPK